MGIVFVLVYVFVVVFVFFVFFGVNFVLVMIGMIVIVGLVESFLIFGIVYDGIGCVFVFYEGIWLFCKDEMVFNFV